MGEFVLVCLVLYILYECIVDSSRPKPNPRLRSDGACYCSNPGNVPGFDCTKCGGEV